MRKYKEYTHKFEVHQGLQIQHPPDIDKGISISGPLGEIVMSLPANFFAKTLGGTCFVVMISPKSEKGSVSKFKTIIRGIHNCITGVTSGYLRELQLVGLGYRITQYNNTCLRLKLGKTHEDYVKHTHPYVYISNKYISIYGVNKDEVCKTQARIQEVGGVDVYKGKGIRVAGSLPKLKAGKRNAK